MARRGKSQRHENRGNELRVAGAGAPAPVGTALEGRISYSFKEPSFLRAALSHSSYVNEHREEGGQSNERLEFLGDSVLSLVVSDYIFANLTEQEEGELTKVRASVVCEKSLSGFARSIGLGGELLLGKGERQTRGDERDSILADAFEALIAAVYLDGGLGSAKDMLYPFIKDGVEAALGGSFYKDYKTYLQEIVQKNREETLEYVLESETGPDHDKMFEVAVYINSNRIAAGRGKSKKEAEQDAAESALRLMGELA